MVFTIARGGSGTSLLTLILNKHPQVLAPFESSFLIHIYEQFKAVKEWNELEVLAFYNAITVDAFVLSPYWEINLEQLKFDLLTKGVGTDFATICKIVYLNSGPCSNEVKLINGKSTFAPLHIEKYLAVFPDAKFIVVIRDYRDNILSRKKARSELFNSTTLYAYTWWVHNTHLLHFVQEHPEQFHLLRYEDLVQASQKTVQDLCDFLNIPFYESILDFHQTYQDKARQMDEYVKSGEQNKEKKIIARELQKHQNLRSPINTSRLEKWKTEMPKKDVLIADFICSELGQKVNYLPSTQQANFFTQTWIKFKYLLVVTFFKFKSLIWKIFLLIPIKKRIYLLKLVRLMK